MGLCYKPSQAGLLLCQPMQAVPSMVKGVFSTIFKGWRCRAEPTMPTIESASAALLTTEIDA